MKVTVVTPLYRVHNADRLYENIRYALQGHDWQWMIVLDQTSPEAHQIESFVVHDGNQKRILNRRYEGGDRWASSMARNMASEIESGWIVNLDDDCLLHENAGRILSMVSPEMQAVAWQTIGKDHEIINYPGRGKNSSADANAFAYQRLVLNAVTWDVRVDADMYFFHKLRSLFSVAFFQVPGAYHNVND